jgi:type IV pilus assembly protein PilB
MEVQTTQRFKDEWLAQALLDHQIMDNNLYEELKIRFAEEDYFIDILTENDFLSISEIALFLENVLQLTTVNLDQINIPSNIIELLPEKVCQNYMIMPFGLDNGNVINIATSNPFDLEGEQVVENMTGRYVKTFFSFKDQVQRKINEYYSPDKFIDSIVDRAQIQKKVKIAADGGAERDASSVVKLLNLVLGDAVDKDASDIHIEPKEKSVQVRFRVDGVLRNILEVPKATHQSLISRIKIISNLDIAETRKPQDGKSKIIADNRDVDLRISILPTNFGEKAVIRILDKRKANVSFPALGIRGKNLELLEQCFAFKQGIVLVTGPTGSGKTTTLYAALNRIRSTTNNILTIEDPIEYMIEGINQVQVNEKAGVTFATALRSFLRQDPDVMLVGEIRDRETSEIAVQAALTGHLVLSTVHTNDTFSTVTRLIDMGVKPVKASDSIQAIIAQRLVRRLCPECRVERELTEKEKRLIPMLQKLGYPTRFYHSKGCSSCGFSGYKGRIGIYEILVLDSQLKDLIAKSVPISQLRALARRGGFHSLYEDALSLITEGITDYDEVFRVINPDYEAKVSQEPQSQPAKPAAPAQARSEVQKETDQPPPQKDATIDIQQMPKRILMVEDAREMRVLVKRLVEKKTKWEFLEAEDGRKALEIISQMKPDVIVLDAMMPEMDGFEFLKILRNDLSNVTIPVIMLTAMKEVDSEVKGFELGADDFLGKPFNAKILFARIKRLLIRSPNRQPTENGTSQPKTATSKNDINFKLV